MIYLESESTTVVQRQGIRAEEFGSRSDSALYPHTAIIFTGKTLEILWFL